MAESIGWRITANASQAIQEMRQLEGVAQQTDRGVGGAFSNIGGMAKGALAGVTAGAVVQVGRHLEELGRTAQRTEAFTATVFGSQTRQVQEWAAENRRAFGVSESALAGMAAQIANTSRSMGLSADEAADYAQRMVELGGNLALVNPQIGGTSDAVEALGGILRKETDALEKLGIVINDAAIKAALAERGLDGLEGQALLTAEAIIGLELAEEQAGTALQGLGSDAAEAKRNLNELESDSQEAKETIGGWLASGVDDAAAAFLWLRDAGVKVHDTLYNVGDSARTAAAGVLGIGDSANWAGQAVGYLNSQLSVLTGLGSAIPSLPGAGDPNYYLGGAYAQGTVGAGLGPAIGQRAVPKGGGGAGGGRRSVTLQLQARAGFYDEVSLGRLVKDSVDAYDREVGSSELHACL